MRECIYCKHVIVAGAIGDHVIPKALGKFVGRHLFKGICVACNNKLSHCDEQILRCGPEAVMRRFVSPVQVEAQSRVGTCGTPPPTVFRDHGNHLEQLDLNPNDACSVVMFDQLSIIHLQGNQCILRLSPKMTENGFRKSVERLEILDSDKKWLHADDKHWNHYVSLIQSVWPNVKVKTTGSIEPGMYQEPTSTRLIVGLDYWRAIAKIAFHYYLATQKNGLTGHEAGFSQIRKYIIQGGDHEQFFRTSPVQFVLPFGIMPDGRTATSAKWMHFVGADDSTGFAIAAVALFAGPYFIPKVYYVHLGQVKTKLQSWGHLYIYEKVPDRPNHIGHVVDAGIEIACPCRPLTGGSGMLWPSW